MPYSYTSILLPYNFTTLPNNPISPASELYSITYRFFTSSTQIPNIDYGSENDYYGSGSNYETYFTALTSEQQYAVNTILKNGGAASNYSTYFGDVSKIEFSTDTNAAIALGGSIINESGIFQDTTVGGATIGYVSFLNSEGKYGDIWFNSGFSAWEDSSSWTNTSTGTDAFRIILHELAHSLGLAHPSDGDMNNVKYTIMSNAHHSDVSGSGGIPTGLQLYDIAAVQSIYGRNYDTRSDNTAYGSGNGFSSSASTAFV